MANTDTPVSIEWTRVPVALHDVAGQPGRTGITDVYQVWKTSRPIVTAYGITLSEAVCALLNRYEELDHERTGD